MNKILRVKLTEAEIDLLSNLCEIHGLQSSHSGMIAALDAALASALKWPKLPPTRVKDGPRANYINFPLSPSRMAAITAVNIRCHGRSSKAALLFAARLVVFLDNSPTGIITPDPAGEKGELKK